MSSDQRNAPVIIKRKKVVVAGGHHGGAWKVAYADFVTAMMAFFMLMWLLGATTEKQRKGIADYFNPTIPMVRASGGGSGAFGGDSIFAENTLAQNGVGAGLDRPTADRQARGSNQHKAAGTDGGATEGHPAPSLETLQKVLQGRTGESMVSELLRRHIVTRLSDEGLVIELFENGDATLFDDQNAPTELLRGLIAHVVPVTQLVKNGMAVQSHTRQSAQTASADAGWKVTAARAESVRQLVIDSGFDRLRLNRVTGFADRMPAVSNLASPRNDRVELILLRDKR